MTPTSLALVSAANRQLASFLENTALPASGGGTPNLPELQNQVTALLAAVAAVGRSLDPPSSFDRLDSKSLAEIKLYAAHLDRLRSFLSDLQSYAETRRDELSSDARQVSDALAWCKTLELTNPE